MLLSWAANCKTQEVGGTFIGEDELGVVIMTGAELVEWYQIHQTHGLKPFHSLRFSHYYELSSPQQPPLLQTYYGINTVHMVALQLIS